jgi:hypothetical protein
MVNASIRHAARESGVKLWEIAERWGCNDGNFSRKLRRPFSPADERRALEIIEQLRREAENIAADANDQRSREARPGE